MSQVHTLFILHCVRSMWPMLERKGQPAKQKFWFYFGGSVKLETVFVFLMMLIFVLIWHCIKISKWLCQCWLEISCVKVSKTIWVSGCKDCGEAREWIVIKLLGMNKLNDINRNSEPTSIPAVTCVVTWECSEQVYDLQP